MQNDHANKEEPDPQEQMDKWLEEIKNSTLAKEFLDQFRPDSVDSFLKGYVNVKDQWHKYGHHYLDESEQRSIRWITAAFTHLPLIQQKKLFDAQCLWRAEQLEIPGLQLCCEFQVWEHNILNCPFIEPITAGDIEMYQAFLLQFPPDEEYYVWFEWQGDFDDIRKARTGDGNFPDWYDFVNMRNGKGVLTSLPDVRGRKERFYMDLAAAESRKKHPEEEERVIDARPSLGIYGTTHVQELVEMFEDAASKRLYKSFSYFNDIMRISEDLEDDLKLLSQADEIVPMEEHRDWRKAIRIAARKYEFRMLAEALPEAWEQYRLNIDLGIGFPVSKNDDYTWLTDLYKERILIGRKLNGEPEDLLF
jgi:hypothetical protein